MRRVAARVGSFSRTAVRGLAGAPVTCAVAVGTIAVTLVLVGGFALLLTNMQGLLDRFGDDLRVTVFLEPGLEPARRVELADRARSLPAVANVVVVSEDEALERFRTGIARGDALLEGLDENPLPASLEITLRAEQRSAEGLAGVAEALATEPGVDDVASGHEWVEGYLRAVALLRAVGTGLAAILAFAALLIVANTIRLAVVARRDEIEILALVGASRSFVSTPFLIEGVVEGAAGGALALALLFAGFELVLPGAAFGLELVLGGAAPQFFAPAQALLLVGGGAALGGLGAGAALFGGLRA